MNNLLAKQLAEVTPQTVAKYFLGKESLSPKKLQKLVYYSYAWFIALNNQDAEHIDNVLFEEKPQAWLHGPVFPTLYKDYNRYGWNDIPKEKKKIKFTKELEDFLDNIWSVFGKYDADELEYMTHQELPWINARKGVPLTAASKNVISDKDMFLYYNELAQAKND